MLPLESNSRVLKTSDNELKLTEREIDTIIFLKNENKPIKVDVLQKEVPDEQKGPGPAV